MLLVPNPSLENLLVECLSFQPSASATWLHAQLQRRSDGYSIQAVYKELRKLQRQGVVIKRNGEYSLHLVWILNLLSLTDRMFDTQTSPEALAAVLPEDGEKKSYTFTRLTHVDDFWMHALIVMLQNSGEKLLYQWIPHPWFHLINSHKSLPLHQAFAAGGFTVKCIIGGDTYLDRYSKKITTPDVYDFYYAEGPFRDQSLVYYSVTDSHLITIKLDKKTDERVERIYKNTTSAKAYDGAHIVSILSTPGRISVNIETRTPKAKKVWNKFQRYFEV